MTGSPRAHRLGALLLLLTGCATIESQLGVPGGRTLRATAKTLDGASITLWRWTPRDADARRVLVLSELGFDHRLVAPLCARLRDAGFDVMTLDGRSGGDLRAWEVDVARAVRAHGPKPLVVAIGVGGAVAWSLARLDALAGVVAINVPVRHGFDGLALRTAMTLLGFNPRAWAYSRFGAVLLGAGRTTPEEDLYALRDVALPISPAMASDVAAFMESPEDPTPLVPLYLLISPKDNLVPDEDALPRELGNVPSRRLAHIELFERDYGHLDWLVDRRALDEIAPVIADALERMP